MPNLVIKPTAGAGNKLILQDQGGGTGATIENATITVPVLKLTPGSAPGSPVEGQMYYNNVDNIVTVYNGISWDQLSNKFSASGGTETTYSGYKVHTFISSATFTAATSGSVDILIVAGGGGGGAPPATCILCKSSPI